MDSKKNSCIKSSSPVTAQFTFKIWLFSGTCLVNIAFWKSSEILTVTPAAHFPSILNCWVICVLTALIFAVNVIVLPQSSEVNSWLK